LCKRSGETIDHILLHYEVSRKLWVSIFHLFGVEYVIPRRVVELLATWRGQLGSQCILEAWRVASLCLMWCIWREWNAKSFEDCERSVIELKAIMFKPLYAWLMLNNTPHFSTFFRNFLNCVFLFLPN
jgi:hypothetical protein